MRVVPSALASLFLFIGLQSQAAPDDWGTVGRSNVATYSILKKSLATDRETNSVQYILRTVYDTPKVQNGKNVKHFLERTLVLCTEDVMISMSQLHFDEKGQQIGLSTNAVVYQNPGLRGQIITELIRFSCPEAESTVPDTPVTKTTPGSV